KVKLIGVKLNRGAIGARVTVRYGNRQQAQEVLSQSSFYSASDSRLHFGLGAVESVSLEIRWPNGGRETLDGVAADQLVVVREGEGSVARQELAEHQPGSGLLRCKSCRLFEYAHGFVFVLRLLGERFTQDPVHDVVLRMPCACRP